MTTPEALAILIHHQAWRKGADTEMTDIYKISTAMDIAISVLKERHEVNPFRDLP